MTRRNIIANYLGTAWSALMAFAFVPVYVRYLGTESYGIIGISVVLQACLSLLDAGITPLMGREMARFSGGVHDAKSIRSLLRGAESITWIVAVLAAAGLCVAAGWIGSRWLRVEILAGADLDRAIRIMSGVVGLRLVEGMYRGCLLGLQRQVISNAIFSAVATLRGAGAVAVLAWWSPSLDAFFWWQGCVSLATVLALRLAVHRSLPAADSSIGEGIRLLRQSWHFAGGMLFGSLLTLLLANSDKLLLTHLLSLAAYGQYALALAAVAGISMASGPICQAIYPRLTELQGRGSTAAAAREFHRAAQLLTVTAGAIGTTLLAFAEQAIQAWTGDPALAAATAPVVRLLAVGTMLNSVMSMPYLCQLAAGWTALSNWINASAIVVAIPLLLWVVPVYGTTGAAAVWVGLNVAYVLIGAPMSFRRVMKGEMWRWYVGDLLLPMSAAFAVTGAMKAAHLLAAPSGTALNLAFVGGSALLAGLVAALTAADTRSVLRWACRRGRAQAGYGTSNSRAMRSAASGSLHG